MGSLFPKTRFPLVAGFLLPYIAQKPSVFGVNSGDNIETDENKRRLESLSKRKSGPHFGPHLTHIVNQANTKTFTA